MMPSSAQAIAPAIERAFLAGQVWAVPRVGPRLARPREEGRAVEPPHRTLQQGAHLVRHVAETLLDRPISVANTPFVIDSFRALHAVHRRLSALRPQLGLPQREECDRLLARVAATLRQPTARDIDSLGRFVRDEMPTYATPFSTRPPLHPLPPDAFRDRGFTHIVAMIGPGIGIGDESKLAELLDRLRHGLHVGAGHLEIHSFHTSLWRALLPDVAVEGLAHAPLRTFERLADLRTQYPRARVLALFACFMRQPSLPLLAGPDGSCDGLEVALSSGELWLRFRGDAREYTYRGLDPDSPNYSRAVTAMGQHLFPRLPRAREATRSYTVRSREAVRVVLNPFTSKHSPLTAGDWSRFLEALRRGIPGGKHLVCRILPGLTASCRAYAREVQAMSQQRLPNATVQLLDDDRTPLAPDTAIQEVQRALAGADLLLTIDTYTAHLAARLRIVSIAICLNRNVKFWDPAPQTFWLNIGEGGPASTTMIRAIARVASLPARRRGLFEGFIAAAERLHALGHPDDLAEAPGGPSRAALWREEADVAWRHLPPPIVRALTRLDADYAWPVVRRTLDAPDAAQALAARRRLTSSSFFRLAWLGAASTPTRGMVR